MFSGTMNSRSCFSCVTAALAFVAAMAVCVCADAVGTRSFQLDTLEELKGGDLEGTSVDSLGRIRAGFVLGNMPITDAAAVWSSVVTADGSVLIGTGNEGIIYRVQGGKVTEYAKTGQMAVTCMVLDGAGNVIAGTIPNGKLYKIEKQGKATEWLTLPDAEHIWSLALDPKSKALYAATGPNGKLYRIAAQGAPQVYFDSDQPHLMSVVVNQDGIVFAGSSNDALLYRIGAPGRATVFYDFPGTEVKALAFDSKQNLFVVANEHAKPPTMPRKSSSSLLNAAAASDANRAMPSPGKGRLYRLDSKAHAQLLLHKSDTHFPSLALDDDGMPHVGTAKDGEVYAVDDALTTMMVADTSERQVGAMVLSGKTQFIATSDPAVFHPIRALGGAEALWNSPVLDAGLQATFGKLTWRSSGAVELSTRTGNTKKPDDTWSAWSNPLGAPAKITSPDARYLQIRARFSRDSSAIIREITAYFVTGNAKAIVTNISAGSESSSSTSSEQIPKSGGSIDEPQTKVKLSWKVDNLDNDELRYRLFYRFEDSTLWRPMLPADEILTKTSYEWDTVGIPEGTYRVKVQATDELANPPDRVQSHELESGTVLVDNTPPVVRLTVANRVIRGTATDGVGPIARIDVAVDPNPNLWIPFFPSDGIFDDATESFALDVGSLVGKGASLVSVRVTDAAGNTVVKTVEVR